MKIEKKGSEMSERPTPETDAVWRYPASFDSNEKVVHISVAQQLERERDEARELARTLAAFVEPDIWAGTAAHNAIDALESILAKTEEEAK
jgi:hypothetical protein